MIPKPKHCDQDWLSMGKAENSLLIAFSGFSKLTAILTLIFSVLSFQGTEAKSLKVERDSMPNIENKEKVDSIEGIVFDDGTALPFSGVSVYFKNSDLKIITNKSGRFKFKPPDSSEVKGDRILIAEDFGYYSDTMNLDKRDRDFIRLFLQPKYPKVEYYTDGTYCGTPLSKKQLRQVRWRRFKWKVRKLFRK